ncbi:class I tRNA ligase family protein [bacterium]|nr:class I tRNA ligase family protein [bacterium]
MVKSTINLVNNLSNWYFDIIKDPLYCDKKDSIRRRQIQTTLYLLLKNYMIALAPFLPHTCEELYQVGKKMFG